MKNYLTIILVFLGFILNAQLKGIEIGSKLPLGDKKVESSTGDSYSLNDLIGQKGLVVIFSSNTCPFVKIWEKDYPFLYRKGQKLGINVVLVNSNEKNRETVDSKDEMLKVQKEFGYEFMTYLIDENSKLADAFDANTTPHIFMFDSSKKLVYRGSIDDRYENKNQEKTKDYLLDAMEELSAGKQISTPVSRNFGCSIKRDKKQDSRPKKVRVEE